MAVASHDRGPRELSAVRKAVFAVLVPLITLMLGFVVVELGLHWLAEHWYGQGKLFAPDPVTGWRNLSNLDMNRENADGDPWRIVTDDRGFRETGTWREDAPRRLLVLGDSLAFGEGTNIEERFDSILAGNHPDLSVINTGTMGYGTFQQVLRARPFFGDLRAGDVLLLVTCSNDFTDITRSVFAARSKPRIRLDERGHPIEELPGVSVLGWLRDKSYIVSRAIIFLAPESATSAEQEQEGIVLYETVVRQDLLPLARSGVRVVLAYYDYTGHEATNDQLIAAAYDRLCAAEGVECVAINSAVNRDKKTSDQLQRDGHWNRAGHIAVAELLNPLF